MAKKVSFEKGLERLEEISSQMEGSNIPLDEAVKLYEEAGKLIKELRGEVDKAAEKIMIYAGEDEETPVLKDFSIDEAD